jgi:hypothetical protein
MKKTISLTPAQRSIYLTQKEAITEAENNRKNQQEKLAFFIAGLGVEIADEIKIELTEEGLVIDDGTGAA